MKSNHRGGATMVSEDGSVLFSLGSLVAKAEEASAPKDHGPAKLDDSGLIDLKALEAAAGGEKAAAHVAIFPFGAPEPLPTASPVALPAEAPADVDELKGGRPKMRVLALLAVALVASAVTLAAANTMREPPAQALVTGLAPVFEGPAGRAAKAVPAAPIVMLEPATPGKEATPSRSTPSGRASLGNPRRVEPSKPVQPEIKPTPKPPVVPDNCDLMCQMRKAATGKK